MPDGINFNTSRASASVCDGKAVLLTDLIQTIGIRSQVAQHWSKDTFRLRGTTRPPPAGLGKAALKASSAQLRMRSTR